MSYFPEDIPFMSKEELRENGIRIPKDVPDTNVGDTISRQAAIDALKEHRALYCDNTPGTFSKLSYAEKSRVDELDTAIATLVNLPPAQPHTYRGVTLNDVMMYFDSLEGNEDAWTELCSCFECRGWELIRIQDGDARQEFMDIVYAELEDDPDNNRANEIIWAADVYAERRVDDALQVIEESQSAQLGTNLAEVGTDTISRKQAIDALNEVVKDHSITDFDAIASILDLPPAQPEIIRCKDCKHWIPYDWMFSEVWQSKNIADYPEDEIGCDCCDMAMKANDYCSRAERRTDERSD